MGDPKFSRKKYEVPLHPWEKDRIEKEGALLKKYGLKNKREIWKAETFLRKIRGRARELLAGGEIEEEKDRSLNHLAKLGLLPPKSTLDDMLALNIESIFSRRLQTMVYLKGLASTPRQARQFIIHGHVAVNGKKVRVPSYMVEKSDEEEISYSSRSPLQEEDHPSRPSIPVEEKWVNGE